MRRFAVFLLALVVSLSIASVGRAAGRPVTPQEWRWITAAQDLEARGDVEGAMEYWARLVSSLKTHNYDACGLYAQKLGRALDRLGRYAEAVRAFEDEFFCWGQFPDRDEWMLWDRRRAEQIRPEVIAFVARPTAGAQTSPLAKHEPAFGTWLGGTIDKDPAVRNDLAQVERVYGKPYAMVLVYARWGEPLPVLAIRSAKAAGAVLQVSWEPSAGLEAVRDDAYVRSFARALRDYGHPVLLRFAPEMNGAWTAWHGDPATYRAKFALIARVVREEAPNVALVWSPNFVGDAPMDDYYPGDEWVDWVGVNLYHDPYFRGDPTSSQMLADIFYQGKRTNPLDKLKAVYERYADRKPIIVSETGFGWANRDPYREEADWAAGAIRRFYGYLPLLYPRVKAVAYFNVDFGESSHLPGFSHYLLSGHPAVAAAYREATAPAWYLSAPGAVAPYFWRPLDRATLHGKTRVAAYVNLGDLTPSRVEYLIDGQVAATATRLPWEAELDLSGLEGVHELAVRAYDQHGRLGAERRYSFDASAIRVTLDGAVLDFDQPPVLLDGRVLVPVRAIMEALGAQVTWEEATRTVVARHRGSTLLLQVDNPVPTRDGVPLAPLDVPAKIVGGRTLVPARFVAETFGMDVGWDGQTRTVVIRSR